MNAVGEALKSWRDCIEEVHAEGHLTARRQVLAVAEQLKTHGASSYSKIAADVAPGNAAAAAAAKNAEAACLEMAEWMSVIHSPRCPEKDGIDEKRYVPWVRYFTGADLDLRVMG